MIERVQRLMNLGKMSPTDNDGYWLVDATANMTARNTTIGSVGTPTVARLDAQGLTDQDVTVNGQAPAGAGLQWTFRAQANGRIGGYLVGFPLMLLNDDVITRYGILYVLQQL